MSGRKLCSTVVWHLLACLYNIIAEEFDAVLSTVAFMAEFNKMASVINGLATNFEMEKEERT
jgi:hypothetical protein